MNMKNTNNFRLLAGIIVFGSVWGLMECMLGGLPFSGAFLGAFIGFGLMAFTRRIYNVMWMQLGMALVAGLLRFWAPVGTCVICSALAIVAEGLIFELIFNRPVFNFNRQGFALRNVRSLAMLGIIAGFTIYVVGYAFTQVMTPVLTEGFVLSNFINVVPIISGTGFVAALLGAVTLPVAVLAEKLHLDINKIGRGTYYGTAAGISAFSWVFVITFFYFL